MTRTRILVGGVVLASAVAADAVGGQMLRTSTAAASSTHAYTLRLGDKAVVPAVGQTCSVAKEGGAVVLLCAKAQKPHHQVTIFRNNILVWKVGSPDHAAWHGTP
jgi:hypothetical protein